MTVTTHQLAGIGVVGGVILLAIVVVVWRLVGAMIGKVVGTVILVALLGLLYTQRHSIEQSVKSCDPKVLGLHVQISDPAQRAKCLDITHGHG